MSPRYQGVLDHLDACMKRLEQLRGQLYETTDPGVVRQRQTLLGNAIAELVEGRRMLERSGQETKT